MSLPFDSDSLDFMLAQVCKLHRLRLHALLEALGLYHGQPPMLFALWEQEGLSQRELAIKLHIQPATATKMIQRMEKTGFIERRADPQDERVSRVYLTDAGRGIQSEVQRVIRQLEAETFAGFSEEERALLRRLFAHMRENLLGQVGEQAHLSASPTHAHQ